MIKVLFETHHLYYLPNFLPIVDEFKNRGNYDIYFSMPQHINQRERDLFCLACKDLGLNTIDANDEELRIKMLWNIGGGKTESSSWLVNKMKEPK